jgi:co-chaperonin GroES (HSP10)
MTEATSHVALPAVEEGSEFVKIDPTKIRVLDCRILVKKVEAGNITGGGILLPQGAGGEAKMLTVMKVIKVGDGRTTDHGVHIPVRVEPGEYVIVGKQAGFEISHNGEYKIINEVEIYGVQEVE